MEKQRENDVRLETDYFAESISTQGDLKFEIETRLLYESVRKAAKQILPLQCRLVYQLIIEEDEDYLNVAQALDLSPSTVKNQKINARRKLKRFVGGEWCLSKTIE